MESVTISWELFGREDGHISLPRRVSFFFRWCRFDARCITVGEGGGGAEGGGGMGHGWGHVGREFPREWRGMIFDERDRVLVAWR